MNSSINFAQPDVTLRLDLAGIIRQAALSSAMADEGVEGWVGRPWADTVADGGNAQVRKMIEDARQSGVSSFHQVRQLFPSGRELAVEYTTVRLGGNAGLIAIGRHLEVVNELRSRLIAAQKSMERDYWKLREVETRYRLLFDASNQPVLQINATDTRIIEANPAAIRALGVATDHELLPEIMAGQRDAFRAMLANVREQGKAPGVVIRLGHDRQPWLVRASLIAAEPASVFVLQLAPATVQPAPAIVKVTSVRPEEMVGKATLQEIVRDVVANIERRCIESALELAKGNRTAAAEMLGLSRQSLYAKLRRYSFDGAERIAAPADDDDAA